MLSTILCQGLEHQQSLESVGVPEPTPVGTERRPYRKAMCD